MQNERLSNYLRCRLTDGDRDLLEKQARRHGLSANAYVRQLLKEKLAHEPAA